MAVSGRDIILTAVGFLLVVIMTPIGMTIIAGTNGTFGGAGTGAVGPVTYLSAYTLFSILLPVLYIVGAALYFIPHIGE
jgi:hypothetical protein